jgi:hypothetical protein
VWASSAPDLGAPAPPSVQPLPKIDLHKNLTPVFAPAPPPGPQDEITGHLKGQLEKDYEKDANPMGSANNHPGFFGKLAHGLSHATGGDTRRQWEEQGLTKQLNEELNQESQNAFRGSETGKNEAEIPEIVPDAASKRGLEGAQTEHVNAETDALKNPQPNLATAYAHAVNQALASGRDPAQDPIVQHLSDAITSLQPGQNKTPEAPRTIQIQQGGKPHQMAWDATTGKYDLDQGESGEKPPTVNVASQHEHEGQDYVVPDGNGGNKLVRIYPGEPIPQGAQTQTGLNSVNTPTTTQRTAAGRAETVVAMAPQVISEINAMGPDLGPVGGRWNDFMQGKLGSDNPKFAGLRADLLMMSSAVALAHAQGRLPENLREEFDRSINAPQQTAANLTATIQHMIPWLQQMQKQGQPNAQVNAGAGAPKVGEVEGGYRFKGGDPAQQSSWEKVTK